MLVYLKLIMSFIHIGQWQVEKTFHEANHLQHNVNVYGDIG